MLNHLFRSAPVANQTWLTCCSPKHPVDNELGSDAPDTVRYGSVMNLCRMNDVLLIATTTHLTIGAAPLPRRMLKHSSGGDPVSYKGEIGEFSDTLDLAHFAMFSISRAADYGPLLRT